MDSPTADRADDAPDDPFPTFDPRVAEALVHGTRAEMGGGLPGYLGMRLVSVDAGEAVLELDVRDDLMHSFGATHGGVVAALVDHALGAAVFPLVPLGTWPATLEFKLNYLAAARKGVLRATATVVSFRKRTAVVRVEVDNDGRAVAAALGTISINPPAAPAG